MKGVGRRRTQPLDDLRNRRRYWELKRKLKNEKDGNDNLTIYQSNISIVHKYLGLLISSILNNKNN